MYSAVYGIVHYNKPLKSFKIRVGHSSSFEIPPVEILPQCAESDVKQYNILIDLYVTSSFAGHNSFEIKK